MVGRHKILLSAYACEPNKGSEPGVGWNWALRLSNSFEVFVITRENNKKAIEEYLKENPNEHLHFVFYDCSRVYKKLKKLPNGIFLYYKKWQREILPIAKKIVDEEGIELVHHITFNEFRTPGKLYKLTIPFVWGPIGGGQFYSPKFKKAYYRKTDIIKERIRNAINKLYLIFSKDIKNAVAKAKVILIADQSTEKIMPKTREYIRLLETGYDLNRNEIKQYPEHVYEPIKLLWVGGIWPRKGLKLLIDALGNYASFDFRLDIIGNGGDKKPSEILIKKYGFEDKVNFLGSLSYDEVNKHYDDADLFIFTSLRDTSGNVVLEAMSHGLPVIAINHHGVGEIVTSQTGTRIQISDYNQMCFDLAEEIHKYIKNPQNIINQGLEARKRIEEMYSWEHNEKVLTQIYLEILEK